MPPGRSFNQSLKERSSDCQLQIVSSLEQALALTFESSRPDSQPPTPKPSSVKHGRAAKLTSQEGQDLLGDSPAGLRGGGGLGV